MRVPPGSQLVFDQIVLGPVTGSTSVDGQVVKSDPKFNDWLGRGNDVRVFIVADRVIIGGQLTVQVEETTDEERAWFTTGTLLQTTIAPGTGVFAAAADDVSARAGRPCLAYRRVSVYLSLEGTGASMHVRIWVTGRNGYRRFNRLLLAERVEGTNPVYAAQQTCEWLAGVDRVALGIQADEVSGAAPTLTLLLSESPNGRVWNDVPTIPFSISPGVLVAGAAVVDAAPISGFLRFGVQLGGTTPAATVRLWVTGRDVRSG